jgi:tetratricopeptide (TPR) repeat protein
MSDYAVAKLGEIGEITDGRIPSEPIRHHFGITAFGVNAWTGREAGDRIINEHHEADEGDAQEELYIVQSGRARFELDGEEVDAPAGTLVFAKPGVKRTAFAQEPGTTVIAVGAVPGEPYRIWGAEIWGPFQALYQEGRYAEAADEARAAVEASDYPLPFYNLACCESLAGRKEDALAHLRQALERSDDRLRQFAREDSDLDPIREESAFKELVGA